MVSGTTLLKKIIDRLFAHNSLLEVQIIMLIEVIYMFNSIFLPTQLKRRLLLADLLPERAHLFLLSQMERVIHYCSWKFPAVLVIPLKFVLVLFFLELVVLSVLIPLE
jgi:hypothetical protein